MRRLQGTLLSGWILLSLAGCARWGRAETDAWEQAPPLETGSPETGPLETGPTETGVEPSGDGRRPVEAAQPFSEPRQSAEESESHPPAAPADPAPEPLAAAPPPAEEEQVAQPDVHAPGPPAATEPAGEPSLEPHVAPAEPPPLLTGEQVGGAPVEGEGGPLGTVEDLLLEPATGAVVGLTIAHAEGHWVLEASAARWIADPAGFRLAVVPAVTPAPAGLDTAALFDAQEPETITGEVRQIELVGSGPQRAAILTLHDDANLLHRVLVCAPQLVTQLLPGVEIGSGVELEGVLTRDAKGKLWIANRLACEDRVIALRDDFGAPLWADLTRNLLPVRALVGASIRAEDGSQREIVGWTLDREQLRVLLHVTIEGEETIVPWTDPRPDDRR